MVRKDKNGHFAYDLDHFRQKKGTAIDKTSLSIAAGKPASSSFSIDNISQNDNDVNNNISSNKYSMQKSENNAEIVTKESKMKASTELNNLLKIAMYSHSGPDDGRYSFAKDGWEYYLTTFQIDNEFFTGVFNVGVNGDTRLLYDINQIKKMANNGVTGNPAPIFPWSSFSADNISQNDNDVNKYII